SFGERSYFLQACMVYIRPHKTCYKTIPYSCVCVSTPGAHTHGQLLGWTHTHTHTHTRQVHMYLHTITCIQSQIYINMQLISCCALAGLDGDGDHGGK